MAKRQKISVPAYVAMIDAVATRFNSGEFDYPGPSVKATQRSVPEAHTAQARAAYREVRDLWSRRDAIDLDSEGEDYDRAAHDLVNAALDRLVDAYEAVKARNEAKVETMPIRLTDKKTRSSMPSDMPRHARPEGTDGESRRGEVSRGASTGEHRHCASAEASGRYGQLDLYRGDHAVRSASSGGTNG